MTDDMKLAFDSLIKLAAAFHKDAAQAQNSATKRDLTKAGESTSNIAIIVNREYAALEAANAALVVECARLREALERIGEWTIYDPCMPTTYDADTAAKLMREMRTVARDALALDAKETQ